MLLTLIDLFLIYITVLSYRKKFKTSLNNNNIRKKLNMTRTILVLNLAFIFTTLPSAIVSGYYFLALRNTDFGVLIITFCDNITFSFHSFNIITLYFSNKRFKKEINSIYNGWFGSKEKVENSKTNNILNLETTF